MRDLVRLRRVGLGHANPRLASLAEFEAADPRRIGDRDHPHLDFGNWWRDERQPRHCRVTWVEATGELISVAGGRGEERVEVIGVIESEHEVERRLRDWAHAAFGRGTIRWVRYRVAGWEVPLPPRGRWWYLHDQEPPKPWPSPSPPSLERSEGVYLGAAALDRNSVEIAEPGRELRPLYQYVDSSPTGFAWGYSGAGPTDLARSILADRLGYVPHRSVYYRFRDEIVSALEDEFTLTFAAVDCWIDEHSELFAAHPRAEPFDPLAAGGA
jgi:hypothetical protein